MSTEQKEGPPNLKRMLFHFPSKRPKIIGAVVFSDQFMIEIEYREPHRVANPVNEQLARSNGALTLGYFRSGMLTCDDRMLYEPGSQTLVTVQKLFLLFGQQACLLPSLDGVIHLVLGHGENVCCSGSRELSSVEKARAKWKHRGRHWTLEHQKDRAHDRARLAALRDTDCAGRCTSA
jgi:hypothetical protein